MPCPSQVLYKRNMETSSTNHPAATRHTHTSHFFSGIIWLLFTHVGFSGLGLDVLAIPFMMALLLQGLLGLNFTSTLGLSAVFLIPVILGACCLVAATVNGIKGIRGIRRQQSLSSKDVTWMLVYGGLWLVAGARVLATIL